MAGEFPGGFNTLIPLFEASGNLIVSYGRNPKAYPLNNYSAMQTVTVPRGAYVRFDPLSANRVRTDLQWSFGMPSPVGYENQQGFVQANFDTRRYRAATTLDQFACDIASFPVQKIHTERLARQVMINRTKIVCDKITNAAEYATSHVVTATALGGGFLNTGTTANPVLMKALQAAAALIQKDTGRVRIGEISILMNNNTASTLSLTREIREYVMQSADSSKMITMEKGSYSLAGNYLLPDTLYRFNVYVEDTYYTTDAPDKTAGVLTSAFPDNKILVFVREGDLEKPFGDYGYSSWTQFVYEDMTTVARVNDFDRLIQLAVTDQFTCEVTSPASTVLITNVFS